MRFHHRLSTRTTTVLFAGQSRIQIQKWMKLRLSLPGVPPSVRLEMMYVMTLRRFMSATEEPFAEQYGLNGRPQTLKAGQDAAAKIPLLPPQYKIQTRLPLLGPPQEPQPPCDGFSQLDKPLRLLNRPRPWSEQATIRDLAWPTFLVKQH